MVEPHHHQSSRKTIRFNEIEQDYISLLPDCLLIDIISRLPTTEEAIRTGSLSKRWQHLWPYVSNLSFIDYFPVEKFVSLVDKTLSQCRQSNLHKFKIHTPYHARFESQFNNWFRYAVTRNVQELDLSSPKFVLDQFMFINSCLTHLNLEYCVIYPTRAISWTKLTTLSLTRVDTLSEDLIENILSGSPLLETFELKLCSGFECIDITSMSVKNFVFSGYLDTDIVEINAPYIVSLTIANVLWSSKLLLVDVSCLVKAYLDYRKFGNYEESHEQTLKGLILSLRHVKELKIGRSCLEALVGFEAKGFICPSNLNVLEEIDSN